MAGLPIPLSFSVTNAASTVGLTAKAPCGAECWAERPSSPHTPRLFHSAGEFRFSKALMQKSKATSIQSPSMMPEGVLLHSEASGKHRGRGHSLGLVHFTRWVRTGTWIGRLPRGADISPGRCSPHNGRFCPPSSDSRCYTPQSYESPCRLPRHHSLL